MPVHRFALTFPLASGILSGLLQVPARPEACYVFAHGAGAGMDHTFMASIAQGLADRGIATLRYNFPFMEQGSKRPDAPAVAQAAVRAAVAEAARRLPEVPLFAGGKSFGGRMTTQAQSAEPLPGVRGIALVGFPLHAAGKPSIERAAHLAGVKIPMLFLQGTRDALADLALITQTTADLGKRASLHAIDGADHAFHVLVRSGRNDGQVLEELLDSMAAWMKKKHRSRTG
jgi:predicted alpha/beta-hydrolase family hydrolase